MWQAVFFVGIFISVVPLLKVLFSDIYRWSPDLLFGVLKGKGLKPLKRAELFKKPVLKSSEDRRLAVVLLGGFLGGAVFWLLISGKASGMLAVVGGIGAGIAWFIQRNMKETLKMKKLREIAALYESIVFYTKAGYTIQQALRLGAVITPTIRPAVERCLAAWPSGPVRALERFAEEVDVPEAATLSTVLMHAEESGIGYGSGAIEEESRALESLRQTLAELKIVSKPLYYCIYRALPLAAISGIVVGPLVWRLIKLLGQYFGFLT